MKKLLLVPVLGLLMASCGGNTSQETADSTSADSIVTTMPDQTVEGTFSGILPAADAAGFETTLELKLDGSYTLVSVAKESTDSITGTYTLIGDTLTLTNEAAPVMSMFGLLQGDSISFLSQDKTAPSIPNVLHKK